MKEKKPLVREMQCLHQWLLSCDCLMTIIAWTSLRYPGLHAADALQQETASATRERRPLRTPSGARTNAPPTDPSSRGRLTPP